MVEKNCLRAGAAFLVAPNLDEEVGAYAARHGLTWCPGTGTVTEMIRAHKQALEKRGKPA